MAATLEDCSLPTARPGAQFPACKPYQARPVCRGVESQAGLAPGLPTPRPLSLQTCLTDACGYGSSTSMRTSAKITGSDLRQNRCVRYDISRSLHSKKNLRLFPTHFRRFMQTGPDERRLLGNAAGSLVPTKASPPAPGARPASRRPYLAGSHRPPPLRRRLCRLGVSSFGFGPEPKSGLAMHLATLCAAVGTKGQDRSAGTPGARRAGPDEAGSRAEDDGAETASPGPVLAPRRPQPVLPTRSALGWV